MGRETSTRRGGSGIRGVPVFGGWRHGVGTTRRGVFRGVALGFGLLSWGGWMGGVRAASGKADPHAVMAAFILNIVEFTTWPETAFGGTGEPFGVGLVGKDPFGTMLDEVFRGETTAAGRSYRVRRLKVGEVVPGLHVLFVGDLEEEEVRRVIAGVGTRPVLTLSARPGFCAAGGMVTFRVENGKVGFEINRAAVARSRLTMNSRLLNVAKLYREPGHR